MTHIRFCAVLFLLSLSCAANSGASEPMEPNSMTVDLARMLIGEWDSEAQMHEDRRAQVPDDLRHGWVNRSFVSVIAPAVGHPVLVGSTAYGGSRWIFDRNEFLVWTFSESATGDEVTMTPRRFIELDRRIPFARQGEKLGGFAPEDLEAAQSGANCEIIWTRSEHGFIGKSKPCRVMSTTRNKVLNWSWTFELTPKALWISFSGVDEEGVTLDGSPPEHPYRLDRL